MATISPAQALQIKADLLTEGIQATAEALDGVGTKYKEQNHGLFGWDFEDHGIQKLPDDFFLSDGTVVQFRKNSQSPFVVQKRENGTLLLTRSGEEVCPVSWMPRPRYYSMSSTEGIPMVKVGQTGGQDCFFVCYNNYCAHFRLNKQCLFCNLVDTMKTYHSVLGRKIARQIGEVAAAAFSEGDCRHILMTGGCFGDEREVEIVCAILGSIRKHTGLERIPGTVLPSPPKDLDDLRRYYDAGIEAIAFSLEIWDEALYRAVCPGKSEETSRERFVHVICEAVKVFGPGDVYGVFVMGLEPADTLAEGVKVLSSEGAHVVPFVWSPNPGSRLHGHRAPRGQWYYENILRYADTVAQQGLPPSVNHCRRCDGNNMLHDGLHLLGLEP